MSGLSRSPLLQPRWPAAPPSAPPPPRPRRQRPSPRLHRRPPPRRSRNMARSASTRRAWTRASRRATISSNMRTAPGRRTRRSRPTSRATACSTCSTTCRRERTRGIIEEQAKDPNSRIGNAYASFMDEAARRGEGPGAVRAVAERGPRRSSRRRISPKLYSDADRLGIDIPYRMFVGQDRKASDRYALNVLAGRPRDARPRLLSVERSEARRDEGQVSPASDERADARRRAERGRAGEGNPRFRNEDRRGPLDAGPRAATRTRPTTR